MQTVSRIGNNFFNAKRSKPIYETAFIALVESNADLYEPQRLVYDTTSPYICKHTYAIRASL